MSEPAEDRLAALEAELAGVREQLARVEPLLRALLKRGPKRAERAANPDAPIDALSEEQQAEIRKRVLEGPQPRRRRT